MDWTAPVDGYCERLDASYWAEPVNALTNLAFIVVAILMWRRCAGMPAGRWLAGNLFVIGVGSWLFHTHAQGWAGLADTAPILAFILAYIFVASRDFLGLSAFWSGAATALFIPYAALTVPVFSLIPGLGSSAGYAPVPLLIAGYAVALWRRRPETARGLAIGAALLCLSILFRSLDLPLCTRWPLGTHFMWHILNAVMLGWMIEVWRRDARVAGIA